MVHKLVPHVAFPESDKTYNGNTFGKLEKKESLAFGLSLVSDNSFVNIWMMKIIMFLSAVKIKEQPSFSGDTESRGHALAWGDEHRYRAVPPSQPVPTPKRGWQGSLWLAGRRGRKQDKAFAGIN